jgi:hypothetical protein
MSFFDVARHSPTTDPAPRCHAIDFDAKRAGRAVVNLHLEQVLGGERMVVNYPIEMRIVDSMPKYLMPGHGHALRDGLDDPWDLDAAALLDVGAPVDAELPMNEGVDPYADVVQWFVDQKLASERSYAVADCSWDEPQEHGEPVLKRPDATPSWRGGGSMYRR